MPKLPSEIPHRTDTVSRTFTALGPYVFDHSRTAMAHAANAAAQMGRRALPSTAAHFCSEQPPPRGIAITLKLRRVTRTRIRVTPANTKQIRAEEAYDSNAPQPALSIRQRKTRLKHTIPQRRENRNEKPIKKTHIFNTYLLETTGRLKARFIMASLLSSIMERDDMRCAAYLEGQKTT